MSEVVYLLNVQILSLWSQKDFLRLPFDDFFKQTISFCDVQAAK